MHPFWTGCPVSVHGASLSSHTAELSSVLLLLSSAVGRPGLALGVPNPQPPTPTSLTLVSREGLPSPQTYNVHCTGKQENKSLFENILLVFCENN